MKLRRGKLLRTGLLAVLILVTANWVAGLMRIRYWRPDERLWRANVYTYLRDDLSADLLVVGSSRILFGVSAVRLQEELSTGSASPSVYNIGQAFGNALKNAVVLRDVFRSNGCPETVLLEVTPGLINGGVQQTRFISEFTSLADLPLLAPELRSRDILDAFLASGLSGLVSLYYHWTNPPPGKMIERARRHRGSRWGADPPKRFRRLDDNAIRRRGDRVREERLRRFLANFSVHGAPARALESIAAMVSECGAQLILVRLPNMIPASTETEDIDRQFDDYIAEFSQRTGAPFHDIAAARVGLLPEHYNDFSHLNYDGAERLSRYMAHEILLPALDASGNDG